MNEPIIIALDIETTGLDPLSSELVSWVCGEFSMIQSRSRDELFVLESLNGALKHYNKNITTIITYNGGTFYNPGFDFVYMRTKCMKYKLPWVFHGFNHVDMYPIIKKMFNLNFDVIGTLDDLKADELKKMAINFGLKAESTMKYNIASINEMVDQDQIREYLEEKGHMKNKSHNGLKDACFHLLGIKDFGVDGTKVPGMFAEWKETGNDSIITKILTYNEDDCIKTMALFDEVKKYVSNRTMSGELL